MLVSRRPPSHTSFSWGVASSNARAPSSHTFFSWCADRAVTHTVLDRSHPTRDVDDGGDDGGDDDSDDDGARGPHDPACVYAVDGSPAVRVEPSGGEWLAVAVPRPPRRAAAAAAHCFVATVDNERYRARCAETVEHLRAAGFARVTPVPLLDVARAPYGNIKILMAGWREVLLPRLARAAAAAGGDGFVLVAEDDARLAPGATASDVAAAATSAFGAARGAGLVSLGHAWSWGGGATKAEAARAASATGAALGLAQHLGAGRGVHATTLLALRTRAIPALQREMASARLTHLDRWLFCGQTAAGVMLRDPPLVGWAEVDFTLNHDRSCYHAGGGRAAGAAPEVRADAEAHGPATVEFAARNLRLLDPEISAGPVEQGRALP